MINNQDKEIFQYTYSAKQQEEINKIRQKYETPKEDKMEQLRKLDASVTAKATSYSLAVGITGTLIMGTGMSLIMTDFREFMGLSSELGMIVGVIIGIIGMILSAFAYPVYHSTLMKERKRIAPQILKMIDELMR